MSSVFSYPPTTWVRSKDRIFAGVCGGIAQRFDLEPWVVRFFWVIAVLCFGTGLLAYILMAVSFPREDRVPEAYDRMLMGVCVRLSKRSDIEISLVRFGALILGCCTLGLAIVAYVVLYFLLPDPQSDLGQPERP